MNIHNMGNRKMKNPKNGQSNTQDINNKDFEIDEKPQFGPIKKRSCTDIWCLFLFIIFLAGWALLIFYFMKFVSVEKIIHPTDSYGNICGRGKFSDRPFVYYFNLFKCAADIEGTIIDGCSTPQVCVSHCPNLTFSIRKESNVRDIELRNSICQYDVIPNFNNLHELASKKKCAKYYFKSDPIGGRCFPSVLQLVNNKVLDELHNETMHGSNNSNISAEDLMKSNRAVSKLIEALTFVSKVACDIIKTWRWIVAGLIMTVLLSFTWIFFMRWIARYMIWLAILALIIFNAMAVYYSLGKYVELTIKTSNETSLEGSKMASFAALKYEPDAMRYIRTSERENHMNFDFGGLLKDSLEPYLQNSKLWLISSIVFGVLFLISSLLVCCLYNRIRLAVAVIEEASIAVDSMKSTLAFPVIPFVFKLIVISFAVFSLVVISSASHLQYRNTVDGSPCTPQTFDDRHQNLETNCTLQQLFTRSVIYGAHAFNLFGLIWVLFFVLGICYVTLAGAFAEYYWTFEKKDIPFCTLTQSFSRCISYHLGSIAFGSLLISIVRFIRYLLEYIDKKCKKYADNTVARSIMCCCRCCFWCLEKFIQYINKNAYIMMAIYGKNFCSSAQDALVLLVSNTARSMVLNWLSDFLIFISKLAVTCLAGAIGFFLLTNQIDFLYVNEFNELHYYWAPLVLYLILSYIITSTFFNVYDVAVDTIFLCYLKDCETNDGSPERPFFMTKSLAKVFDLRNNRI